VKEKDPSVRQTSQHHNLSVSTIRAFLLLESQGLIEPAAIRLLRARRPTVQAAALPPNCPHRPNMARGEALDTSEFVLTTLRSINQGSVPLGLPTRSCGVPVGAPEPVRQRVSRRVGQMGITADLPPGNPELIRQIARRHLENGLPVDAAEIIVTTGATGRSTSACKRWRQGSDRGGIAHLLRAAASDRTNAHARGGD
jgi:DNA-binding transcriptional MocR family regulator